MANVQHSSLTGADLHEPKGVSGASSNQTYVSNGAGSGSWSEPEPKGVSGADAGEVYVADGGGSGNWVGELYTLHGVIADISTAETVYVPVPIAGTVQTVTTVLEGAITVANALITVRDSAAAGMATITVAFSGSAAGDVDFQNPSTNNIVTANDYITVETDGGSTTAQRLWFTITVRR
jgi:hypothetical protein